MTNSQMWALEDAHRVVGILGILGAGSRWMHVAAFTAVNGVEKEICWMGIQVAENLH